MCTFILIVGGHLARPIWTGETPIPQDFQIKLHIALGIRQGRLPDRRAAVAGLRYGDQ